MHSGLTTQLGAGGNQPLHRGAGGKAHADGCGGSGGIAADGTRQAAQGEGGHLCGLVKVFGRGSRAGARGRLWVGAAESWERPGRNRLHLKRLEVASNRKSGKRAAVRAIFGASWLSALRAAQRAAASCWSMHMRSRSRKARCMQEQQHVEAQRDGYSLLKQRRRNASAWQVNEAGTAMRSAGWPGP